ncbi:ROK family transcriptional regulator [Clostridium bowmanii]|uniref:ROK family transcriptional regulator n=1 Tax=Clostridium bowmanii TaxID=132925 RepID=UPI001C0C034A|nr:ROK family transcriptional regulator [Clostridium bowmanii]MBU3191952.1 ROK family transcriptional regulator [Clostridium bowmanii]MCA1074491.1 ROK family transcriptional regulator [Clostridium bowmanii]
MLNDKKIINQKVIKQSNRKKILNLIAQKREYTKQNISQKIGVSIPTVISNINELIQEGLVEEAGVAGSTGGRKPIIVRFLPNSKYSFGIEFTLSNVRIILVNLDGKIKFDNTFKVESFKNIDDIIDKIHKIIGSVLIEKKINHKDILGIGFSLPGTVNEEKLTLELAPNIGVRNVDFSRFSQMLEFPIYIENEANSAAFGEVSLGIAKKMRNLVYLSINEGIGAGVVIQDRIYKGKNKRAGEMGHMTIVPNGKPCNCGRRGCLEQYASKSSLMKEYNSKSLKPVNTLKEFFSRVEQKENIAILELEKYIDFLAIGIQNIVLIIDPHYVILGGEMSDFSEYYLKALKEKVFVENSFYDDTSLKIFTSKLKKDSSILGAALLPMQNVFSINGEII